MPKSIKQLKREIEILTRRNIEAEQKRVKAREIIKLRKDLKQQKLFLKHGKTLSSLHRGAVVTGRISRKTGKIAGKIALGTLRILQQAGDNVQRAELMEERERRARMKSMTKKKKRKR